MADVKWIKLCTDVFDDEKIQLIDALPERDGVIVIWFKLLCLAGKQNNGGVFMLNDKIAYTDEMLATIFRRPLNTVRLALSTFENFGMVEIINNTITIPNWDKHQSLDKLEQAKEKNRKRVAKHRAKQKQIAENSACNVTCNDDVTPSNATEEEKEREEKKEKREEAEEVKGAFAPDDDEPDDNEPDYDKLEKFRGHIILSENQLDDLLNRMELDVFEEYIARLNAFIEETGANIKSHYKTLLKWYNEDRAV